MSDLGRWSRGQIARALYTPQQQWEALAKSPKGKEICLRENKEGKEDTNYKDLMSANHERYLVAWDD